MRQFFENCKAFCRQVWHGLRQIKTLRLSHLGKVFSLMGHREKILLLAFAGLATFTLYLSLTNFYYVHTKAAPGFGGSYTEGFVGQPTYLNPLLAHQEPDLSLEQLIFSGLYNFNADGHLVPDLADGMPQISADQKQYVINLKHNVKWHNGKQFTADDVIFTVQALQDPGYKSPLRGAWQSTTVEKLSDYSVKFTTKDISGPFVYNLTLPILPKNIWGKIGPENFLLNEANLKAVGTGPYAIKEIKKQASGKIDQITLQAFGDFYQGQPRIGTIVVKFYDTPDDALNALHSREIQGFGLAATGNSSLPADDNLQTFILPLPQYQIAFFNLNNPILADDSVRQALNLALDRRKLIADAYGGQALLPTSPLLMDDGLQKNPLTAQPDLAVAGKLLDAAGWTVDGQTGIRTKKGQALQLRLLTNDFAPDAKAAASLVEQYKALDIKVDLTILSTSQLTDTAIRPRNFDILLLPVKFMADPDPFLFWHSSQTKDPGFNLSGFSDQTADKLIADARTTTNQQDRRQKYQQLDQLLDAKLPALLLDQQEYIYQVSSEVKNIQLQSLYEPGQRFWDLRNWYITEKRVWK
ncbi:MAG: peptide ABC transporter substrate-binding protein [Patescibacteria group bacterium]|nr:peptide ABC transporter substrate-binding protein [Patescibacteria group bacterium]